MFDTLFQKIGSAIISFGLLLGGIFPMLGATNYNPTGGGTYRLQSSITSTQTTVPLSSFKEPVSNLAYTMSYLNSSIEYGTIEPSNNTNKEFISFTGITQNSDGSATLTGVTRGLSFSYPYTASTTFQQAHAGQTIFILSNPPQLTNQYANKTNSESINPCGTNCGTWTFASTSPPQYDANVTASGNQFVPFAQLNSIVVAGGATSTEGVLGYVALNQASNLGVGTASTTSGAPLVIQNKFATTTPGTLCTGGTWNCLVATVSGKIAQAFLDLTQAFTFSGGLTSSGATTIAASGANTLTLGGTATTWQIGAYSSSTVPAFDSSGKLTAAKYPRMLVQDGTAVSTSATSPTALYTLTLAPGTMGANDALEIDFVAGQTTVVASDSWIDIQFGNGSASTTITGATGSNATSTCVGVVSTQGSCRISATIQNLNSVSNQLATSLYYSDGHLGGYVRGFIASTTNNTFSGASNLYIAFRAAVQNASDVITVKGIRVMLLAK